MRLSERMSVSVAVLVAAMLAPSFLAAEEPLRWKFENGEKLDYNMVQDMTMAMEGGPVGKMETKMRQQMDMTWNVQKVNADGSAEIRQTFDRVQMTMTTPGGEINYDSDSVEAPAGMAAMIAPMYKAMTEAEFIITMSDRGQVTDVKIPDEVIEALKNSPGAAMMGDLATSEGFKKMIAQGSLVLPEDSPEKGESWTSKVEMENPMAGKQTVETTYRYEDTKEMDGATYAVIRPEVTMSIASAPQQNVQMKVTEQTSEGEVLFNVDEGRLHTSKLKQNVTLDVAVGGQSMKQKIDQTVDVTVKPADEAETEDTTAKSTETATP
jgi:hypothetical protein